MNAEEPGKEYLERIPFVTELLKRIDDISQAIRQGNDGVIECLNLLSDLPGSMQEEIKEDLNTLHQHYKTNIEKIRAEDVKGTPLSYKMYLDRQRIEAGQDYSRNVKQKVINMLDSKGLLILSRKEVPESQFVDMHDKD